MSVSLRPLSPRRLVCTAVVAAVGAGIFTGGWAGAAGFPVPRPAVKLPAQLDPVPPYEAAKACKPAASPGATAFRQLILATYQGTGDSGILRACTAGGTSEHKEGRAWDWRVSATNTAQAAQAAALLDWLTAADAQGRTAANARRLGVMYVIWNDRIWSPSRAQEGWRPYVHAACKTVPLAKCSTTLRHRDHVHFSFTWAGANKTTSFWTGRVGGATKPTTAPAPKPAAQPALPALTRYYGVTVRPGQRSANVTALQKALRMSEVTGYYGPATRKAANAFHKARKLKADGIVSRPTWAALQADLNRHSARIAKVSSVTLRPGARHATAVPVLEAALRRRVDGTYDSATVAAVRAFQRYHGRKVTGTVDAATWRALRGL
jgi:peptidoglycan hydrolase-like protein with peptidoglycan-binding domain